MLHMICGKIASGKSTLAADLSRSERAVLICEDDWLQGLYAQELVTLKDYVNCTRKLRSVLGPHISALLTNGVCVVLDAPANTVQTRQWIRNILNTCDADHRLHVIEVSDALCLNRLHDRNTRGTHPFTVTPEQFEQVTAHFDPPSDAEGFNLVQHVGK